jgi:hypothetical protein
LVLMVLMAQSVLLARLVLKAPQVLQDQMLVLRAPRAHKVAQGQQVLLVLIRRWRGQPDLLVLKGLLGHLEQPGRLDQLAPLVLV